MLEKSSHRVGQELGTPAYNTEHRSPSTSHNRTQELDGLPPGLLGDVARFIYDNAPYPNVNVAIVGSLGFLAALFGRSCNVSGTGLNIWITIVGETAIGKEAAQDGISKLVSACIKECPCIGEFVGPSKWASPEAMHKRIAKTPSVVGFMGELGIKVKTWCSPKAAPMFGGLIAFMLDVYGKSGKGSILQGQENSDRDKNTLAIHSPALTLLGDTTPSTLFEALDERLIANGFLPRWIMVNAGDKRGRRNKKPVAVPSYDLATNIKNAAAFALAKQTSGEVTDVALDADAERLSDELEQFSTGIINGSSAEVTRHLWSRVHLNVLKVAAISAVGRSFVAHTYPTVSAADFMWARHLVTSGVEAVLAKFANGEVGEMAGNEAKQLNEVVRVISEYMTGDYERTSKYGGSFEMHRDHVITEAHIQRRLFGVSAFRGDSRAGPTVAIKRAIKSLLDADELREISRQQMLQNYGTGPRAFVAAGPRFFRASNV